MKRLSLFALLFISLHTFSQSKENVLKIMHQSADYFQSLWPDTGMDIPGPDRVRPSNIWTRAVYYEGLMELYKIDPLEKDLKYMLDWAENHRWNMRNGVGTRNGDDQACGQIYLDLYKMYQEPKMMANIKENIDRMVASDKIDDWTWVDLFQMAMPVYARLANITGDKQYLNRMHEMYAYTKNIHGGGGLYDKQEALWFRDKDFVLPYLEPNGEKCFWSRGNGWTIAALVRVLEQMDKKDPFRKEYEKDLVAMANALVKVQREDGFWNTSLKDPNNYGGPELTGTSLFVYGIAYGLNHGLLKGKGFEKAILKGWEAMESSIHPNGFLGYIQGTGKQPSDSQPTGYNNVPNFVDFGPGCYLLGASEFFKYLDKK